MGRIPFYLVTRQTSRGIILTSEPDGLLTMLTSLETDVTQPDVIVMGGVHVERYLVLFTCYIIHIPYSLSFSAP